MVAVQDPKPYTMTPFPIRVGERDFTVTIKADPQGVSAGDIQQIGLGLLQWVAAKFPAEAPADAGATEEAVPKLDRKCGGCGKTMSKVRIPEGADAPYHVKCWAKAQKETA